MPTCEFPYHDNRGARNGVRGSHIRTLKIAKRYSGPNQLSGKYSPAGARVEAPENGIDLINLFYGVASPRIRR